jgi:hypothetical protein
MKKSLYLFACLAISLALLSGCGNYNDKTSATEAEKTLTKATSSQSIDKTNSKPTPYKTVNNYDNITVTIKKGTLSPTGLTLVFENDSNKDCLYGEMFELEKKINGGWHQVPVVMDDNYGFDAIGYSLASGEDSEWAVDWNWLYGSLDAGEYRIVKTILVFRGTGNYDEYPFAAEFVI